MLAAALFTKSKIWKQPKCPSTDERIKMTWCMYTMEYYSAIKKNKILSFAATCFDLEGIMLTEKDKSKIVFFNVLIFLLKDNVIQGFEI